MYQLRSRSLCRGFESHRENNGSEDLPNLVKLITLALVTLTKKADADASASKKLAGVEVYPRTDIYYEEIKVHSGKVLFYKACQLTILTREPTDADRHRSDKGTYSEPAPRTDRHFEAIRMSSRAPSSPL